MKKYFLILIASVSILSVILCNTTNNTDPVKLILNGTSVTNISTSPMFIDKAVKVVLILNAETTNAFTDRASYSDVAEGQNAVIFSQ